MSNPAHSVEHIEKQQRSITPQEQVAARSKEQQQHKTVPIYYDLKGGENGAGGLLPSIQQPVKLGTSPLASFVLQSHNATLDEIEPNPTAGSPLASFLETPQKPHLLPPMMFTSSNKEKRDCSSGIQQLALHDSESDVPLLTRNQLQQALAYLLMNDSDFVAKLHEAYIRSVNEKLNLTNGGTFK